MKVLMSKLMCLCGFHSFRSASQLDETVELEDLLKDSNMVKSVEYSTDRVVER